MTGERAYLDHNASTPLRPAAADAFARALALVGNPSSIHAEGRAARALMDKARAEVAAAFGAEARNVVFASGATEALNMLLRPSPAVAPRTGAGRTERLLALATEHSAVRAGGGFGAEDVEVIPVDGRGLADADWLARHLAELSDASGSAPVTVAIHHANSETGVIQPMADLSQIVARHDALMVCDAVASAGKIPVRLGELNVDAIVVSAHKFGGPKGVGAVVLSGDRVSLTEPLLKGGGQERRLRSGTENVAGIAAMGAALTEAVAQMEAESVRLARLREQMIAGFRSIRQDIVVFGEDAPRLPNTAKIAIPGLRSETGVIGFDLAGVAVSAGAACASGKVARSHVLDAMGADPALADSALRFSLGWTTTEADIDLAIGAFGRVAGGQAAKAA